MGQMDKKGDRILEVFYEWPQKKFTVRELAKMTKVPKSTVQKYLTVLKKEKLILEGNLANNSDLLFKTKKINFYVEKVVESGLVGGLVEKLNPSCIILFGSIRKGEAVKESDIDLFVEAPVEKKLELEVYEKKLKREIQLFVHKDIKDLPDHLFNNVTNGIKLYGSFAIK